MFSVDVCVVDSGVCQTHKRFNGLNFAKKLTINNGIIENEAIDSDGHGTAVLDLVRKTVSKRGSLQLCNFHIVKVYDSIDKIMENNVIKALEYVLNSNIKVINISLGLISAFSSNKLKNICQNLYDNGKIIVASAHNFGKVCYPAHFPFVFGVTGGIIDSLNSFGVIDEGPIEFIGKGTFQRVAWIDNSYSFKGGTSFATPHITGIIASELQKNNNLTFYEIKELLFSIGKRNIRLLSENLNTKSFKKDLNIVSSDKVNSILEKHFDIKKKFGWLKKISIYPYSIKEFSALERFDDLFEYDIVDIIDYPRTLLNSKTVKIKNNEYKRKIKIDDLSQETETLILGYPDELGTEINSKFYEDLIKISIEQKWNIFSFDKTLLKEIIGRNKSRNNSNHYYCPIIHEDNAYEINSLHTLGRVNKPVLAVISTSRSIGKFSTQLKIKRILQNEGYKTGWLTTEPQGILFGANYTFPYGYRSTVEINADGWPGYLYHLMKGIEEFEKPDILVTGHQGGMIPIAKNFVFNSNIHNLLFLSGIQADAFICMISPVDDIEIINRVWEVSKNLFQVPILFFVLPRIGKKMTSSKTGVPMSTTVELSDDEWQKMAEKLNTKFNVPVVDTFNNEYNQTILDSIENFF